MQKKKTILKTQVGVAVVKRGGGGFGRRQSRKLIETLCK